MLASLCWNDPLVFHVTFVPNQDNLGIIPRVCFDLSWPKRKTGKKPSAENKHKVKEKDYVPQMMAIAKNEAQMPDI